MTDKQIIIDGVNVSEWTDEEIRYNFEKHSPKAIRQIAFDLYKQLKRKEQKNEELKQTLAEIKFWARELLKRTGQVVPYEIKQILQKINECEVENERKENCN